jgi:hypothetical protein
MTREHPVHQTLVMVPHEMPETFRLGSSMLVFQRTLRATIEPDWFSAVITHIIGVWAPKRTPTAVAHQWIERVSDPGDPATLSREPSYHDQS